MTVPTYSETDILQDLLNHNIPAVDSDNNRPPISTIHYDRAKDEFTALMELMIYYGNVRFLSITAFSFITFGLMSLLFSGNQNINSVQELLLKVGGIIIAFTFWATELSAALIWRHLAQRCVILEKRLAYNVYKTLPDSPNFRVMPTTILFSVLYSITVVFWISSLLTS